MSALAGPLAFVTSMEQWVVLLFIGLLLFGKRLPQVLKDAGRKVAELKRSLDKLRQQMHEDKDFRELSTAAQDLREAVTAPRRMITDTVRNVVFEAQSGAETLRADVQSGLGATTTTPAEPAPEKLEGLTDESRSQPGPDAQFVAAPEKSIFEREAESLGSRPESPA